MWRYSRKANAWPRRLPREKAKSFTIDGEAAVLRPDGLTGEEEEPRNLRFFDRKVGAPAARHRGILLN